MICVGADNQGSLQSVNKWRTEITRNLPRVPITLILTKKDLIGFFDKPVTLEELKDKQNELGLQGFVAETSSKQCQDLNVHRAFMKVIKIGYHSKYEGIQQVSKKY